MGDSMLKNTGDYRWALAELAQRQKTSKGAPAYSRYINRPMGRRLAAMAYKLGLTPNQVTALSALCTFSAIALIMLLRPTWWQGILVAGLLVLGYALDSADGQLARLQNSGSAAGEWLDHVVDAIKTAMLHLAVLVSFYRFTDLDERWYAVAMCFQVVATVQFFSMILTDQLRRLNQGTRTHFLKGQGRSSALYSLAVVPTDFGLMCLVLGLMFVQPVFLSLYALLLLANAGFIILALGKWYREVRSFG